MKNRSLLAGWRLSGPLLLAAAALATSMGAYASFRVRVPYSNVEVQGATLELSASSLDFATVSITDSAAQSITIRNVGQAAGKVLVETPTEPFSLSNDCPASLGVGQICTVQIAFTPMQAQAYATTVKIAGVSVLLEGMGNQSSLDDFVSGGTTSFAKLSDGTWWAAGSNHSGQLGLVGASSYTTFTHVEALEGATKIVASTNYTYVQKSDGTWWAVGYNSHGQLGQGDTAQRPTLTPVPAITGATDVIVGGTNAIARMPNGSWWGTGGSECLYGAGTGCSSMPKRTQFTEIPEIAGATLVIAASDDTFARMPNGTWVASGWNSHGQYGLGDTGLRDRFTPLPALTQSIDVAAGRDYVIARMPDGSVWAAGSNQFGQLGLPSGTQAQKTLKLISALDGARSISAGSFHTVAIMEDGSVKVSGWNSAGQLGLGDLQDRFGFVTVPTIGSALSIKATHSSTLVSLPNHRWVAAGNDQGGFGLGSTGHRTSFTELNVPH